MHDVNQARVWVVSVTWKASIKSGIFSDPKEAIRMFSNCEAEFVLFLRPRFVVSFLGSICAPSEVVARQLCWIPSAPLPLTANWLIA